MNLETVICRPVNWERSSENKHLFRAVVDGEEFSLRLNDFPEEPLCTLIGHGQELDLEEFGEHWRLPWHREQENPEK